MDPFIVKLHEEAKAKAAQFHTGEADLIEILSRVDQHKVFIHYGYASLFEYCLKELNLSESYASGFITVARKTLALPVLKKEILDGGLSVSKIRKMTAVLTPENAQVWIDKAKSLTHKALEKEVAKERPEVLVPQGHRYISGDRIALQICISEELMEELSRLQDVLSKEKKAFMTLEKALSVVVKDYLDKHDPLKKAEKAMARKRQKAIDAYLHFPGNVKVSKGKKPEESQEAQTFKSARREHIAQMIKNTVMIRDQAQCTFVYPNGRRCKARRYLQMHHIKPLSQGGPDTEQNLILLCSAHHKHIHFKMGQKPFHRQEVLAQQSLAWMGNEGSPAH